MTQEYDFSGLGEPDAHLTATRRAKAEDISPAGQSVGQDEAPMFDFSGLGAPDAMYGMSDRVERLAASGALVDATGDYAGDVRADMAELELASLPSVQGWRTAHDPLFGTDARLVDLPSAEGLDTWDAGNEAGVADEHEATVMRAAYALDMAGRVSPEAALEALRAARLTGTPFSAALRNRDAARRVLQLPGLDDLRAAGPRTLAALADTEASLVAHDDVKHLSGLERALDKFAGTVRAIGNIPYRAPSVAGRSAGQMAMMVGGAVQYAANAGGLATALPGYRDDANPLHLLGRAIENVGKGSAEHYQEVLDLPELAARPQADYTAEQVWEKPLLMLDPEWLATQGGDVLVQQLVNIAAYVAGGAPLAALAGGAQEAGAFWQQLRDDGMDVNTALSASLAFGMATGVLESLGAGAFFADSAAAEASRAAAMRVLGKLPARAQGVALDVAAKVGAGATEGLTEYLENPIQNGIEAIAQGQPLPQVLSAMAEGLRDLTPIGPAALLGLGAGGRVHRPDAGLSRASFISPQAREIAQLMADIGQDAMAASSRVEAGAALTEAAAAVDASRLHGRSADIFEEVAAGLLPEEAGNLWLDADTVRSYAQGDLVPHENEAGEDAPRSAVQTVDPARLEALGVTPEELEAAGRSGAPMQVDTLRVLSRTSGGERDALLASARLAPSGMTLDEAHDHDPEARMRDGLMRVRSTAQVTADVAKEERRIASELRAAGLARHVAQGYAALHAEQARAFSARYGVDPVVLLARRRFVQGSEVPEIEAEEGDGWSGTGDDGKEVLTFAQAAKKSIYSDDRSVRMDFEDTGVEPSLTDREQLRAYLESLHPADVKRLKLEDENAYLAMLKSIVRKFFPEKGTLRFRKEGEALDYAHFVGRDVQRDSYVHTLLPTLKNDDITVEFATAEGKAKAYLIKKYFDAELQKDIWDMLVLHDGELTTKIARKGRKGGGYVESQIMGAGNEASHSATTGGAIENASTPRGEYALTITPAGNEGKTAPDSQAKGGKGIKGERFAQGERARVTFSEGEALVQLFKGADLSSVAHESGHIFLDDLESVAAADATQMLESLDRRLGDLGTLPVNVQAEIDRAKVAATEGRLEDIAKARKVLRDIQRSAEQDDNAHMTRAARRADTALGGLASHMRGLEKARADLAALREWAGVPASGDLTAAQRKQWHEATARGFEAYLREGTPPSQKLSGLFATFRRWLTAIYRRSRDLDVELTDEVRTVFDRMLATDEAMRRHRDISVMLEGEGGFISQLAEAAGGDTEIALRLDDLRNKAEQNVQAGMDAATLRDRSERLAGHRREARRMVAEHPLWSALTFLSRGPGLNRAHLVENYGAEAVNELAKRRPGLVRSKGGMALDDVANERGFEDADTLWNEMYDRLCLQRETQASATEDLAQQMLAAEDAEADPGDMFLAGDSYGEYLEAVDTELLKLMAREKGWKTPEAMAARVDALRTPREYIRAVAANEIGSTPLRDVRPDRYSAALRKALGERTRSLASGDLRMAFRALEQVRIAHELGSMAVRVRREMEDAEVLGRRLAGLKPGAVDNLAAEGIRRVLHSYGLGGASAKARNLADALVPLRDILAAYHGGPDAPMDVAPSFPDWLLDGRGPDARREPGPDGRLDYRNLTHGELRDVVNLLRHLEHMGREARGAEKNTEAARVTAVANEAAASMRDLPAASTTAWRGTERRRWQDVRDKFWAEHTALRWQFGAADAYANIGPDGHAGVNEQALFGAITEGEEKLRALRHDLATRLTPIMDRLSQRVRDIEKQHGKKLHIIGRDGKPLAVPSLWAASGRNHWTVDNALALALNMGNESNMQRVLAGYQDLSYESVAQMLGDDMATRLFALRQKEGAAENVFTPPAITGPKVQGLFTREDWQDIQQILDVIDSLWPETEAVHKRLYGFAPNKVEAKGILLPGLGHLYLNGGYYPVMYDGHLSGKVAAWTEADDILNRNDALFQTPAAKRGHTKARSDGAPGLPVRLDTGVLLEHIDNAARFIAFAEPVRFVDKVTQSPAWREQYVRAFGKHDHDAIRSNLRGLVRNDAPAESGIVMGADILRKYIVNVGLAWNIKTALLQSTAVFPAMQDIGREYVWAGIKKLYTTKRDAVGIIREIQAVSPYMASRAGNIDQDMQQLMRGIAPEKRSLSFTVRGVNIDYEKVVEAGMLPIVYMDMVATTAVWLGAYQKRMDELAGAKGGGVQLGSIDPQKAGHEEAMRYADDAVKRSNPDFDASSRSSFLRSNGAARLFNMFCSATELYAQRQRTHAAARKAGKLSWRGYARFQLYDTLLPATAMWLLQAVARGMFGSDDDREKLPGLWLASLLDFASARLPVFGSPLVELATGEYGARGGARVRSTLDAGFDVLGKARRGTGALFGDWDDDTLSTVFWAVGDIISMAARIPVAQRLRSAVRGYEQWQDGEGTPLSLVMPRPKHF